MKTHLVIPDTQVKEGVPLEYLSWIGEYIVERKPDRIIHLGDFADMPSLSSYDKGKKGMEGRRYKKDIEVSRKAMELLMAPYHRYRQRTKRNKKKLSWNPSWDLCLGNHENRINRAVDAEVVLEGQISVHDLAYEQHGWKVHPFLEAIDREGILYSHYFPRGPNGNIAQNYRGAPSARAQLNREKQSCTAGHQQGLDFAVCPTGTRRLYGMIAGSCYMHDEEYLTPQGTNYWKGIIVKHQVENGEYDPMFVSLNYLQRKYD